MEDNAIILLYFQRAEEAIAATSSKYKHYCSSTAGRMLHNYEEEECVNDTWLKAWEGIPPLRPSCFRLFHGTITRNLSIDKICASYKRKQVESTQIADELEACLAPSSTDFKRTDSMVITDALLAIAR